MSYTSAEDDVIRANLWVNMGNYLSERYDRKKRLYSVPDVPLKSLYQAISFYNKALRVFLKYLNDKSLTKSLIALLTNLGSSYGHLYQHTKKLAHLEYAMFNDQMAIDFAKQPNLSRQSIANFNNLGSHWKAHYLATTIEYSLEQSIESYQNACYVDESTIYNPRIVLISAKNWGEWAWVRQSWQEAIEAYSYGIEAINRLFQTQLQRHHKEIWLKDAKGLHANATYAYTKTEQVEQAIITLEHGRAFLLSEALERTRTDLQRLPTLGHADLYKQYQSILNRLWVLENQETANIEALRNARSELDSTIEKIRQVEGYSDFLQLQPTFKEDIVSAMINKQMVLVYTAVTHIGSVALIVQPNVQVAEVWLDDLKEQNLREKIYGADDANPAGYQAAYEARRENREAWHQAIDDITHWLWKVLMGPIIAKLHDLAGVGEIENVVLIPQGLLGLLPLHAAWTTEDSSNPIGRRYALDEFLFTYTPNARALKASRERAMTPPDSIFAVDNPDPNNPLKFAGAEVTAALSHFPPANRERLDQTKVSFHEVKRCLEQYPVAHFATHGRASITPLESSLSLGPDEAISLRAILNMRLKKARLAILSACETAIPGQELPDEVVSLPTGLVQAGFAGVVGSLWAVDDFSAMLLIARFYKYWREDENSPAEALRQAQIWLRCSSRQEKRNYLQALKTDDKDQTAQIKQAIRSTNFKHPYYWAAFSYTGV